MSEVNLDPTVNSCFNFYQANMNNVAVPVPFIDFTKTETNIYQQSLKKVGRFKEFKISDIPQILIPILI